MYQVIETVAIILTAVVMDYSDTWLLWTYLALVLALSYLYLSRDQSGWAPYVLIIMFMVARHIDSIGHPLYASTVLLIVNFTLTNIKFTDDWLHNFMISCVVLPPIYAGGALSVNTFVAYDHSHPVIFAHILTLVYATVYEVLGMSYAIPLMVPVMFAPSGFAIYVLIGTLFMIRKSRL